jgi:predicted GIY-YIG superfamily endonuclease
MDYKNGKVYKLQCEDGYYYIGSTATELRKRSHKHKQHAKEFPERRVYQHINALGWDRVRIILIEDCPCESKEHLRRKEDEHIRACRDDPMCLNMYNATHNALDYQREYHRTHKEQVRAKTKEYVEAHRDELNSKRRDRRRKNKEVQDVNIPTTM